MTLSRAHRVLIAVVVSGAIVIAAIGFAGSYAAVRELALHKGFGTFSYLFPIGIDAGICVLLALDLLLTWIRIPFPMLRQTAWLLTAATIAFNAAAAWPDPLGVGMHAVIPILFVVTVEAARHAIGRIADITADKHMEGVRITRWLLSPLPTLLLWRRTKLWELRSYEQAIKLEQERLVYQTHLRSRYGRAWRHKAPIDSLMPLRLARYGIPLTDTAPAGLTAAGINHPLPLPAAERDATTPPTPAAHEPQPAKTEKQPPPTHPQAPKPTDQPTAPTPQHNSAGAPASSQETHEDRNDSREQFLHRTWPQKASTYRELPAQGPFAHYVTERHGITHTNDHPLTPEALEPEVNALRQQESRNPPPHDRRTAPGRDDPTPIPPSPAVTSPHPAGALPTHTPRSPQIDATIDTPNPRDTQDGSGLTKVDGYFLAWREYQQQHGQEPTDKQLSAHLADKGILGRGERPISPSTLRRYFLPFRLYTVWAQHRQHTNQPSAATVAQDCASRQITAQYNQPITTTDITTQTDNFQRRWHTLTRRHTHPNHRP
ncbi:DUF2637 domain-containing protein [Streptomyces sp. NPDC002896]|uniref:DUF2637 domain-containing protein n=1 Tax=Streptomyces sp. NPDC002896 TaxID=3154438 RepID=UPI00332F04A4